MYVNMNSRGSKYISLTASYTLSRAMSNTDGINTFPASPYTLTGEYGPSGYDFRHRVSLGGSINTKWNWVLSPLLHVAWDILSISLWVMTSTAQRYLMDGRASQWTRISLESFKQSTVCWTRIPRRTNFCCIGITDAALEHSSSACE